MPDKNKSEPNKKDSLTPTATENSKNSKPHSSKSGSYDSYEGSGSYDASYEGSGSYEGSQEASHTGDSYPTSNHTKAEQKWKSAAHKIENINKITKSPAPRRRLSSKGSTTPTFSSESKTNSSEEHRRAHEARHSYHRKNFHRGSSGSSPTTNTNAQHGSQNLEEQHVIQPFSSLSIRPTKSGSTTTASWLSGSLKPESSTTEFVGAVTSASNQDVQAEGADTFAQEPPPDRPKEKKPRKSKAKKSKKGKNKSKKRQSREKDDEEEDAPFKEEKLGKKQRKKQKKEMKRMMKMQMMMGGGGMMGGGMGMMGGAYCPPLPPGTEVMDYYGQLLQQYYQSLASKVCVGNTAMTPMKTAAFIPNTTTASSAPYPRRILCCRQLNQNCQPGRAEEESSSEDDLELEDGVGFAYKPQQKGRTEFSITVEPKKQPWLPMMRAGFRPVINCSAPPCYLNPSDRPGLQFSNVIGNQIVQNAYASPPPPPPPQQPVPQMQYQMHQYPQPMNYNFQRFPQIPQFGQPMYPYAYQNGNKKSKPKRGKPILKRNRTQQDVEDGGDEEGEEEQGEQVEEESSSDSPLLKTKKTQASGESLPPLSSSGS